MEHVILVLMFQSHLRFMSGKEEEKVPRTFQVNRTLSARAQRQERSGPSSHVKRWILQNHRIVSSQHYRIFTKPVRAYTGHTPFNFRAEGKEVSRLPVF